MDVNFVRLTLTLMALVVSILGLLLNFIEPYLPVIITRGFQYGKFSVNTDQPIIEKIEVPKRWFKHFYMVAAPASTFTLYLTYSKYLGNGNISESIYWILDMCFGTSRQPLVSPESTLILSMLMSVQCWKRLYETCYVSVFSDKNMNISHYIAGHIHYAGTLMSIIAESKGFVKGSEATFSWERITLLQLICAIIFLYSSYAQLQANFILRNLRKNEDGTIVSTGYKIPHGGLFKYTSGALQFTEILIYVTASIILWQGSTFHYVTLWVIANQWETALLTHRWYLRTFKSYPKTRKALVPYLF